MIRAVLVTAVAFAAAWGAGAPDPGRHPVRSGTDGAAPAHAVPQAQPQAPATGFQALGAAFDRADRALMRSGPLPETAARPVMRPTGIGTDRPFARPATAGQIARGARIPPPPASLRNASDLSCIAVAIYHEARNQNDFGQRAIASVILQRAALSRRWGDTACDIVVPRQFSFMTSRYDYPPIDDMRAWKKAVRLAARVMIDGPMPELKGADHYHAKAITPNWASSMVRVRLVGDHIFYVDPRSSAI
ncbi:cell wall hydrolase [Paracoccus yeei]|uniref:cell wall hydrolase n=1 Tax=Paracoccus yeei TaxID=147645 RepID=UPI003BF7B1F7